MINLDKIVKEEKIENTSEYLRYIYIYIKKTIHNRQPIGVLERESKENVDGNIQRDNDKIYQN